jgi:hypothetical protein
MITKKKLKKLIIIDKYKFIYMYLSCHCIIIQSNLFKKSLKYYESIKSHVFSTSYKYVVRGATFFQCVSLIELNTYEDE